MGRDYVCLKLLLACCAGIVLPASAELQVYDYEAEISAGGMYPSPAASSFFLRGKLDWQTTADTVVIQLRDVTTSLHNGPSNQKSRHRAEFLPLVDEAKDLLKPFTVHTTLGGVIGLSGVDGEVDWSINMKRSIASLVHVQPLSGNITAFVVKENGVYGSCNVEYNTHAEGENLVMRKYLDHSSCDGFQRSFQTNDPIISPYCPGGQDDYLTSSSDVTHKYTGQRLVSVHAKGALYAQPFKAKGEVQQIISHQRLTLSPSPGTNVPSAAAGEIRPLKFAMPEDEKDITGGRNPLKQSYLMSSVKRILLQISESLDEPLRLDPDFLHDERVPHVLYLMSHLEQSNLVELFAEYQGTSYLQETLRNIFLQVLPRVGSRSSILLIRDLVVTNRVNHEQANELLLDLPFHVRHPTPDLLQECEVLYKGLSPNDHGDASATGILTFATLVYQTCNRHCPPEVQDKYVREYFDSYNSISSYKGKLLWLQGLSNMEDGRVFEYLVPEIRSGSNNHLRFLAVWATMGKAMLHPDEVYALYWPILSDRNESLEMRVAALTMLVVSRPSVGRFFSLHWFMTGESNPRLKHFYYTTMLSLVNTVDPCFATMSGMAAKVLRLLPLPPERHWSTGNYIVDQGNTDLGFGSMFQLFLVANQKAELPTVLYLEIGSHAIGQRLNQLAVFVKLEGVSSEVRKLLLKVDPATIGLPQLANLLRQMQAVQAAQTSADESVPFHLELILKVEGRTIICDAYNEIDFQDFVKGLTATEGVLAKINNKLNLNLQDIDSAMHTRHQVMTDLGMPAVFLVSVSDVSSVRGNASLVYEAGVMEIRNHLDLLTSATAFNNLGVYNPVIDLWQGVQRSTNLRYMLPIHASLLMDERQEMLKITLVRDKAQYLGMVSHVRSAVFVKGRKAEDKLTRHCALCQPLETISRGKNYRGKEEFLSLAGAGLYLEGLLFDCEHHNGYQALGAATRPQNYQVFPASKPFVIGAHLLDCWLMVAPPGSCGTQIELTTAPLSPPVNNLSWVQRTEVELTIQLLRSNHSVRASLTQRSDLKTENSWTVLAQYKPEKLAINVMRDAPTEEDRKLCMDVLVKFPTSPTDKLSLIPSAPLTVSATFHMAAEEGKTTCGGQPADQLPVELNIIAETTEEQATMAKKAQEWPFAECKSGNDPDACNWAAREMATLRKYTALLNYSESLEPAVFILGRGPDGKIQASMEVSTARPVVVLSVGGEEFTLDTGRHWIDLFLVNTRYPLVQQVALAMGLITPEQAAT